MRATTFLGAPGALAVALALAVTPAAAQAGGTPGPSPEGGSQYGAPLTRAHPARPVARYLRVVPRSVVAPALPQITLRVDEYGARTVRARIVLMPVTKGGTIARVDLGRIHVGRPVVVAWPAGTTLAPGSYRVRLHVRGLRNTVLARSARLPGRAGLTVAAPPPPPPPPPPPVPNATGHVFPVAGPHTFGDGIGAARNGHTHQGQDILAAEGTPVVAPFGGTISFTDSQPSAAGYYVVEKAADGYDYFFAHCQEGSTAVAPGQPVVAGQRLCNVGHTGDATGPHLHFEAWVNGWRAGGASQFVDPMPLLQSWGG